ncbi:MMPL family transporter [Ruania suaedae]|uniref:MMPL family transporter n=1 Tax=Ruania suaedae TaxID=2897774 RepID=UPI001E5F6D3C|nr:MMPL family transporter [Ruania suaedae]UFU01561.1 MMPL family transporter [Ruania suaedae]
MFDRLGAVTARAPRRIVVLWLVLLALAGTLATTGFGAGGLFDRLHSGEPRVPGSETEEARTIVDDATEDGATITAVLSGVDLESEETLAEAARAASRLHSVLLADERVESVTDPFIVPEGAQSPAAVPFLAEDGDGFVVTVTLDAALAEDAEEAALEDVTAELGTLAEDLGADARLTSAGLITDAIIHQMESDLVTGEIVALPISLLIMVIVFGGFLAAGMPLAGALASIAGGLAVLWGFSAVLELDSVVVNIVTVLGLGLSIDYGLLIVSRFREEIRHAVEEEAEQLAATGPIPLGASRRSRRRGHGRGDAAVIRATRRTLTTAGRTVAFSAVTVAVAVSGLLLLRPDILRSLGAAGLSVVALALLSALTLVPALLAWRGRRMLRPSALSRIPGVRHVLGRFGETAPPTGLFSALAGRVQRHPWVVMLGTAAILLLLASPLLGLQLRSSTVDMLPPGTEQREVVDTLEEQYPALSDPAVQVLVGSAGPDGAQALSESISDLPGVSSVDPARELDSDYDVLGVRLPEGVDAGGQDAQDVVTAIRDLGAQADVEYWVYGQAASQIDFTQALIDGVPLAAGVVVLATFVLLFAMTGSILVPLKALIVNLLSLAASVGVTTWVFQEGHLSDLLGFEPVGGLESYVVAVVVAFGFGLAMDYEVFLIARIKEFYDRGPGGRQGNDQAVRDGLQQSGRIITSAAAVIVVVFAGFISGELVVIKQAGFALAVTVIIDATLVRMLLVPATMTLLGSRNWWAPRPLRALHRRIAITH